ncbi:MAG: TatD family hydrolase, partial [Oscillospiraceae bacterium]|nr:TatD family hydrolase [Oscillospiraceae bacterium]
TILDLGWYISFTGVVTFKNAKRAVEVAAKMPIERLMIETDSPYMSPEPVRGTRNDSRNVRYVAEKIAALRGLGAEELARVTLENGKRFYGLTAK